MPRTHDEDPETHDDLADMMPGRRLFLRNTSGVAVLAAAGIPLVSAACDTGPESDSAGAANGAGTTTAGGNVPRPVTPPTGPRTALSTPGPMLPPVPAVLLTVNGAPGDPDEISVVWSFVLNGEPAQIGISVGDEHVAGPLVAEHGEFVLNVPTASIIEQFDRVDMNSSRVADKYEFAGLTRGSASVVDAPTVEESPLHLECRVTDSIRLPPTRTVFFAEVVATAVSEGVVDENERLIVPNVAFFGMTAGSGEFYTMGRPIGHIGKSVGRSDIRY